MLILNLVAVLQRDLIVLRRNSANGLVVELEPRMHQAIEGFLQVVFVLEATAHQCPAGLVVVPCCGVDDGDVVLREVAFAEELVA
jgi:hypothetical protein